MKAVHLGNDDMYNGVAWHLGRMRPVQHGADRIEQPGQRRTGPGWPLTLMAGEARAEDVKR
ncbi:hypothetical protein RCH10_003722 [Variovorax sp. GrIS 2.14]|uniref:hypothetical protein n=1 Tax=Variovorax sp. GrIS 2.14 TaxID=3071709 RepID=UPI0038F67A81